jgi:hypothetical protein
MSHANTTGGSRVKGEPECIPMAPHEVISRAGSIGEQDFSHAAMASVTIDDLESEEFDRMRWLAVAGGDEVLATLADEEILKALNLVTRSGELTRSAHCSSSGARTPLGTTSPPMRWRFRNWSGWRSGLNGAVGCRCSELWTSWSNESR